MKVATHPQPVWRSRANFIIIADFSNVELQDHWEQLWAEQVGAYEFVLCCIPFFTYDLSLGDRVHTYSAGEREYVIESVLERSQRRVYRLWLEGASEEGRLAVKSFLQTRSLLHEWRSDDFVAFDVASDEPAVKDIEPAINDLRSRFKIMIDRGG